jgi:hypothetical protein
MEATMLSRIKRRRRDAVAGTRSHLLAAFIAPTDLAQGLRRAKA